MSPSNQLHYQQKLKEIKARRLSTQQRVVSFLYSTVFWLLLFVLLERVQYVWVPYVIAIQSFSHILLGYLTYFFAALFFVVWFYLIYRTFKLALKYLLRGMSGIREH